jgi:hypothetical protein
LTAGWNSDSGGTGTLEGIILGEREFNVHRESPDGDGNHPFQVRTCLEHTRNRSERSGGRGLHVDCVSGAGWGILRCVARLQKEIGGQPKTHSADPKRHVGREVQLADVIHAGRPTVGRTARLQVAIVSSRPDGP